MDTDSLWTIFTLLLLILMSAFFSASEMALSSVNKVRIKTMAEAENKRAKRALKMIENFDHTLSVILIGNNIVNIAAASAATIIATTLFGVGGAAIATIATTVIILIFGEVLPKSYAKENSEKSCLFICGILPFFILIFTPLAWIFVKIQSWFSKRFGNDDNHPLVTEEELLNILETIEEEGVIDGQRSELMQSALAFDDTTVQEVLTPRVDLTAINIDETPEKIKQIILGERFSRIPVFKGNLDNIIGILHTRDYLEAALCQKEINLAKLVSKPMFVHKTQRISSLLNEFKHKQQHLAIVSDDFGGTMGIVTMEDLLEELVGEIWDEDEEAEIDFKLLTENCYEVSGDFPIDDTFELIGYEEKDFYSEYSTIGGWAIEQFGVIPSEGDSFCYNGINVIIKGMDDQRILTLEVRYNPTNSNE